MSADINHCARPESAADSTAESDPESSKTSAIPDFQRSVLMIYMHDIIHWHR